MDPMEGGRGKPFYPRWVMEGEGKAFLSLVGNGSYGRGKPFYPRWVMDSMGGESLSILGG